MNNLAPIRETLAVKQDPRSKEWFADWTNAWVNWFKQVSDCLPWKKAFNVTTTIDFPSTAAFSESPSAAIVITGARQGDSVEVTPYANAPGLVFAGTVTADDQVTIYAKNFTNGAKDPASMQYRIIVKQN